MGSTVDMYENFIGCSKLSKTLRNELIPTPSTRKHIEENGIIDEGENLANVQENIKYKLEESAL